MGQANQFDDITLLIVQRKEPEEGVHHERTGCTTKSTGRRRNRIRECEVRGSALGMQRVFGAGRHRCQYGGRVQRAAALYAALIALGYSAEEGTRITTKTVDE